MLFNEKKCSTPQRPGEVLGKCHVSILAFVLSKIAELALMFFGETGGYPAANKTWENLPTQTTNYRVFFYTPPIFLNIFNII